MMLNLAAVLKYDLRFEAIRVYCLKTVQGKGRVAERGNLLLQTGCNRNQGNE